MKLLKLLLHLIISKSYVGNNIRIQFKGSGLKQDKITYTHETVVNIYIVYELSSNLNYNYLGLENSFLGAVRLNKNDDIDRYIYSGYGIGFDGRGNFLFPSGGFGCNVIIFGVDMSSAVHVDNKKTDSLILSADLTQRLESTTLIAERKYSINFNASRKKFCLSLHHNGTNSYLKWYRNY